MLRAPETLRLDLWKYGLRSPQTDMGIMREKTLSNIRRYSHIYLLFCSFTIWDPTK